MSKDNSTAKVMGELFVDATKEIVEKTRIRSQMARLKEIMSADHKRLRNAYAEIGKMYCEGTLDKNKARLEMLYDTIEHLKLREERATARYEQLKEAHSVDECTTALREDIQSRVQSAKEKTLETAKDLGAKAKAAVERITQKDKDAEEYTEADFTDVTDDFDEEFSEEEYTEDSTEDEGADSILGNIEQTLREVDEIEETPQKGKAEETAKAEVYDDLDCDRDSMADGESPDSFDF